MLGEHLRLRRSVRRVRAPDGARNIRWGVSCRQNRVAAVKADLRQSLEHAIGMTSPDAKQTDTIDDEYRENGKDPVDNSNNSAYCDRIAEANDIEQGC